MRLLSSMLLALALAACGARSELSLPDERRGGGGGSGGEGGGSGAATPVEGCELGELHVLLDPPSQPVIVDSLAPFGDDGTYIAGYGVGWPPDLVGEMALLTDDASTLADPMTLVGEDVVVGAGEDTVAALVGANNQHDLVWLRHGETGFEELSREPFCPACAPWRSRMAIRDQRAAIAWRDFEGTASLSIRSPNGTRDDISWPGGDPAVFPAGNSLLLVHGAEGGPWIHELSWDLFIREQRQLTELGGSLKAAFSDDGAITLIHQDVLAETVSAVPFDFGRGAGTPTVIYTADDDGLVNVYAARSRGFMLLIFVGVTEVRYAVYRDDTYEPEIDTSLLTEVGSIAGRFHVLPHPDGFAIVYGGWETVANYAMYGRLVRCARR
jgi:hypothetical protein